MKQYILLVFSFFIITALSAQELEFSESPVILTGVLASDFEGVGYSTVNNIGGTDRMIRWESSVVEMTDGWNMAVCDKIQCYEPVVTSEVFSLVADEEGRMDVHVYPGGRDGSAVVEITVTDTLDAAVTLNNLYYFNTSPSSTGEAIRQSVKVYPNPSHGLFSVKAGKQLATVQVYSLTGQQVKSFSYNDGQWYDITDLPKGTYLVRLIDRDAQQLVTKLMHKL